MKKIRAVIAIPISPDVRTEIEKIVEILKQNNALANSTNWIEPEKYHINLITFGIIPEEKMHVASEILQELMQQTPPLEIGLGVVSYFYKAKNGDSQIYLDISDKEKLLRQFFNSLTRILGEQEFYPPERLHAHIVLGIVDKRKQSNELKDLLSGITEIETPIGFKFTVDRVGLFESVERYDAEARLKPIKIYKCLE